MDYVLLNWQLGKTVARIALVSPERSRQTEEILLRLVQSGQIRGKVTEEQLIELLDQVASQIIQWLL
jgi:DNA-binding TFAR19-related protein (PDSD5 family)